MQMVRLIALYGTMCSSRPQLADRVEVCLNKVKNQDQQGHVL